MSTSQETIRPTITFLEFLKRTDHIPLGTFLQILKRVFLLKRSVENDPRVLCTCSNLGGQIKTTIHDTDCIVDISKTCWSKLQELLKGSRYVEYTGYKPYLVCTAKYKGAHLAQKKHKLKRLLVTKKNAIIYLKKIFLYILKLPYKKPLEDEIEPDVYYELLMASPKEQKKKIPFGRFHGIYPEKFFFSTLQDIVHEKIAFEKRMEQKLLKQGGSVF